MDRTVRDTIIEWCEKNNHYELSQRIAFVPDEILEQLLFETPYSADKILSENGY